METNNWSHWFINWNVWPRYERDCVDDVLVKVLPPPLLTLSDSFVGLCLLYYSIYQIRSYLSFIPVLKYFFNEYPWNCKHILGLHHGPLHTQEGNSSRESNLGLSFYSKIYASPTCWRTMLTTKGWWMFWKVYFVYDNQ